MRHRFPRILILAVPLLCLLTILIYNLPPVNDRLAWRIDNFIAGIKYAIHPPEDVVFVPQETAIPTVQATLPELTFTPTLTSTRQPTLPGPTSTPLPSPTPTLSPTPIPASVRLKGIIHEYQKWNNCGPATLAMALSFWGWQGDQRDTASYMKPNPRDKNVMPYEMQAFIEENTSLKSILRYGGDLELLKRLIAAGFPPVIERGFEPDADKGWMGHFNVFSGYDDVKKIYIAQDSYIMPDLPIPYKEVEEYWQHFNYLYLIIYPAEREAEVFNILGPQVDEIFNLQYAAQIASDEIYSLGGRGQFFAWYNRGTNLVKMQDFAGAATAYDQAFAVYPTIPEKQRPWRMLWYQTGPYFAYFYTGRYNDVITLASTTIANSNEPAIEESFYWRGMARAAIGDTNGAIEDYKESLKYHPDFAPSLEQLKAMGVEP